MAIHHLHSVIISLGCNIDQEEKMQLAQQYIKDLLHDVRFSSSVWTDPIDFDGDRFLNCVGLATTNHEMNQMARALKFIQHKCGDTKGKRRLNIIAMDIDILKWDTNRYHLDDWKRDYVKQLVAEVEQSEQLGL